MILRSSILRSTISRSLIFRSLNSRSLISRSLISRSLISSSSISRFSISRSLISRFEVKILSLKPLQYVLLNLIYQERPVTKCPWHLDMEHICTSSEVIRSVYIVLVASLVAALLQIFCMLHYSSSSNRDHFTKLLVVLRSLQTIFNRYLY